MRNMSYCRFENTSSDMQDCLDALDEEGFDSLSENEKRYARRMLRVARELVEILERDLEREP